MKDGFCFGIQKKSISEEMEDLYQYKFLKQNNLMIFVMRKFTKQTNPNHAIEKLSLENKVNK